MAILVGKVELAGKIAPARLGFIANHGGDACSSRINAAGKSGNFIPSQSGEKPMLLATCVAPSAVASRFRAIAEASWRECVVDPSVMGSQRQLRATILEANKEQERRRRSVIQPETKIAT